MTRNLVYLALLFSTVSCSQGNGGPDADLPSRQDQSQAGPETDADRLLVDRVTHRHRILGHHLPDELSGVGELHILTVDLHDVVSQPERSVWTPQQAPSPDSLPSPKQRTT